MHDGNDVYIPWVGVVENIDDPLKNGRVKVRIFGWHTEDLIKLPTASLPWATVTQSSSGTFSAPIPGDFVNGYFADGRSSQNPYVLSVLPGVRDLDANPWDTSRGFSPQPLIPGEKAEPDAPEMNPAIADAVAKNPTTNPYISKGIVAGTGISLTNSSLGHVCDFRYSMNFDLGISSLGLINPVTAIQNAIKSGKNKAAMLIASIISQLNDQFRLVIKGILVTLNLDPSGVLASAYSYVKNIVRQINEITIKIAKVVETVSAVYYLIQDIQQIVNYLKTLPARFLAVVQDCITNFLNGIKKFTSQVLSIPGAIGSTIESVASNLSSSSNGLLESLTASANTQAGDLPPALRGLFTDPNLDHSTVITEYITNTYDANTVMQQAESSNFDPNKVQWA